MAATHFEGGGVEVDGGGDKVDDFEGGQGRGGAVLWGRGRGGGVLQAEIEDGIWRRQRNGFSGDRRARESVGTKIC
jgi:hypothetical protein